MKAYLYGPAILRLLTVLGLLVLVFFVAFWTEAEGPYREPPAMVIEWVG